LDLLEKWLVLRQSDDPATRTNPYPLFLAHLQKFFVIAFAVIAAASAASIATDYLPPVDNNLEAASEIVELPAEQGVLADDGYRYKTVRRLKLRHRRDVNELPSGEYLPPAEEAASEVVGVETPLADDGYRYKTVRRVIRRRRDVNELPSAEYLPPVEEAAASAIIDVPAEQTVLAADGYRYKTVRRLKLRRH